MSDEPVRPFTLTRLSGEIARGLSAVGRVAVPGEIAGAPRSFASGAWFTLKDRQFALTVHVPGKHLRRSHLEAGARVVVTGHLGWQARNGEVQLQAEEVVPVGDGAAAAMVEAARRSLAADGLLDRPRRVLPLLPRGVGVLCGNDSAVRHDIASVVDERFRSMPVRYEVCTITGPGAARNIVEALERLLSDESVDVVVLARGGGDATQLLPWSDEELCRAVAAARVPVVAAIGHEEDRPLVDEVADVRCGTPSIAAARVVPSEVELRLTMDRALRGAAERLSTRVAGAERRLAVVDVRRSLDEGVLSAARRLERAGDRLAAAHPARALTQARDRIARVDLARPVRSRLEHSASRLAAAGDRLADLGPGRVLRRGYAVVRTGDGTVVRTLASVRPGDRVTVEVADGRFVAVVADGA